MQILNLAKKQLTSKKQLQFHRLKNNDVNSLRTALQEYSDCYLISSLEALSKSKEGRKILFQNIKKTNIEIRLKDFSDDIADSETGNIIFDLNVFKIIFNNINDKKEAFTIGLKELNKYFNIYKKQKNHLVYAMKMAMQKLIEKHPTKKPFISRIANPFKMKFEYNKPSNFLKMFTGKEPIVVGESDINLNLKKYKDIVFPILEKMGATPKENYSFVVGTGIKGYTKTKSWHCLVIEHVNGKDKIVTVKNKRANARQSMSFDDFLKKFKYIVGYFNENLK